MKDEAGKEISVKTFVEEEKEELQLKVIVEKGMDRKIGVVDINRPGLALAGFTGYFMKERIQIFGKTEISFIKRFDPITRELAFRNVVRFLPPCVIVTEGMDPFEEMKLECERLKVPLLVTAMSTTPFIHSLTEYLDMRLAPETYIHGTLVDVYGVGLLITGESGIGKSETALDLVERGHRLVADDLIKIKRRRNNFLIGESAEENPVLRHHMEIRGLGIINLYSIFGVRSIRVQKRIEVIVELVRWEKTADYERVGLDTHTEEILGVSLPKIVIPVLPGRNLAMICEVIAMNHLVKLKGFDPAKFFNEQLKKEMERKIKKDEIE